MDLDLDLEADLGIDTVKQAEVFAAIRESYGIERDDNLKLRDYPTLASVIGFVNDRRPEPAPAPDTAPAADGPRPAGRRPATAGDGDGDGEVAARVVALVAEQTGYPPDLLDLDLDLEADLGIDTVKQAEVFAAIRASYGIERDDNLKAPRLPHPGLSHRLRERPSPRSRRPRPRHGPGHRDPGPHRRAPPSPAACPCRSCARRSPRAPPRR